MSVLADRDLRARLDAPEVYYPSAQNKIARLVCDPRDDARIQPASIDLTLSNEWLTFPEGTEAIDMDHAKAVGTEKTVAEAYLLQPHELILCSTVEYVEIPRDLQAQVHGKSSLGRLGLLVHVTAGFIDPGFRGKITLEMYNLNNRPILLRAGKRICQLSLTQLYSYAERPYGHEDLGSHYQNQTEVTGSRYG
jgi:dCTP deaminase